MTLEVVSFRQDHTGKWRRVNCGYAKKNKDGDLNVYLDAIPAPIDGQWRLVVKPRREQGDQPQQANRAYDQSPDLDDSVPF